MNGYRAARRPVTTSCLPTCGETVVVGYACYGPIACTVASYDLYWIAVDPQFQRHGIGQI